MQSGLKLFPDAAILIVLPDGDKLRAAAFADTDPVRAKALLRVWPVPLTREYNHAIAILDRRMIDIPEARDAPSELATGAQYFLTTGYRAITIMPMMRGGDAIGALSVVRAAPGALSDKQIAVLRTFADQAVIAIENTRLLNELRQRPMIFRVAEQQTATADVLKVISSSPGELEPVFDAMLENAVRICEATLRSSLVAAKADFLRIGGNARSRLTPLLPTFVMCRYSVQNRRQAGSTAENDTPSPRGFTALPTYGDSFARPRSSLPARGRLSAFPCSKTVKSSGQSSSTARKCGRLPKSRSNWSRTFAAQAVIAIENARLLSELRKRTMTCSLGAADGNFRSSARSSAVRKVI